MENCVFSLCTCIPRTQEFDALVACGVVVSSPLTNKVQYSFVLRGRKDYGMIARTLLTLVIGLEPNVTINLNYLYNGRNFRCYTRLLCCEVGKAKRRGKF
jgi:hypothetical protein